MPASELVLNQDKSVYHLKLKPKHIGRDIIIAGDPGRVALISSCFDKVEYKISNREFVTHTGYYKGKKVTALATGIGTDNIDIVMNELDALVNIDLEARVIKENLSSLNIVRIGTSGALQEDIPVDSMVMGEYGIGFDGLLNYYNLIPDKREEEIKNAFLSHSKWEESFALPYVVRCSDELSRKLDNGIIKGITATAPGFYGPQGRTLRLSLKDDRINEKLNTFDYQGLRITNFEMETSALYGLGRLLGHNCCTICVIIANRFSKDFSSNYQSSIKKLIIKVLDGLTKEG